WAFWSSAHCPYVIRTGDRAGIEAAALGASESALPSTTPAEALHTFTLDSSTSRYFFRECTTFTPLSAPVPVKLADHSGGQSLPVPPLFSCVRQFRLAHRQVFTFPRSLQTWCLRAASPTISGLLATVVTNPSFESTTASALVAEMVDFAAACRLDYATALVAESESASPPSVGGECALGTDVLEDGKEDFECLATVVYRFASMLLALEGDPDAPDIPTPRSYAEAFTGPYSSQLQEAMDAEMASWKSTGTYVDAVPPSRANIVNGMWIFRVKRPPCSLIAFKARYVARCFSQQQGVNYFQTFSPTPKISTLRVLLHVPRTTLAALGFTPSTADPSLFLRTDTSLLPFYVLVYVDDLVFATADTEALTLVKSELQKRHTCTDLGPSALRLPVLLATAHSSVYRPLALSSTFGRVRMEAVALHARESALLGTAPAKALHTFTLDSGTSRYSPVAPSPCSPLPATPSWHALPPPYLWSSQVSASPLASSLPTIPDPESDLARAASPTVSCLLASVVTDPSFESSTVCAFVAELVDFGAACRLDYATVVVAESESASPPPVFSA
ncbi:unnamed protein product, partial [Closterium sp. NIES-53]